MEQVYQGNCWPVIVPHDVQCETLRPGLRCYGGTCPQELFALACFISLVF